MAFFGFRNFFRLRCYASAIGIGVEARRLPAAPIPAAVLGVSGVLGFLWGPENIGPLASMLRPRDRDKHEKSL